MRTAGLVALFGLGVAPELAAGATVTAAAALTTMTAATAATPVEASVVQQPTGPDAARAAQQTAAAGEALLQERLEQVADSIAYTMLAERITPGLTVAVGHAGEIVFQKGYGLADVENGVAARPETVYRIGSITKQFTSAAVMRMVERGEIDLEDPITRWLPDYPLQGHDVRVRHLLNHTSGIKSYTGLGDGFWEQVSLDLTDEELIALFQDEPFDFAPGEGYLYNNSGYYLLGVIVGTESGTPYPHYVEGALFEPLGLDDTLYCDNERIVPFRAEGYAYTEAGALENAALISMNQPGAAGALCLDSAPSRRL